MKNDLQTPPNTMHEHDPSPSTTTTKTTLFTTPTCPPPLQSSYLTPSDFEVIRTIDSMNPSRVLYVAKHRASQIVVALKRYDRGNDNIDGIKVKGSLGLYSQLHHAHIVDLYCAFETLEHIYQVTEFCPGGNLATWRRTTISLLGGTAATRLSAHQLSTCYVKQVLRPMLQALTFMHSVGVSAKSLKPENILFTTSGVVKLSDVALGPPTWMANADKARLALDEARLHQAELTPLVFLKSLQYIAPEAMIKMDQDDALWDGTASSSYFDAVDTWSCGVITLEVLTGSVPFLGETREEIIRRILKSDFFLAAKLERDASDFVFRCLRRDYLIRPMIKELVEHAFVVMDKTTRVAHALEGTEFTVARQFHHQRHNAVYDTMLSQHQSRRASIELGSSKAKSQGGGGGGGKEHGSRMLGRNSVVLGRSSPNSVTVSLPHVGQLPRRRAASLSPPPPSSSTSTLHAVSRHPVVGTSLSKRASPVPPSQASDPLHLHLSHSLQCIKFGSSAAIYQEDRDAIWAGEQTLYYQRRRAAVNGEPSMAAILAHDLINEQKAEGKRVGGGIGGGGGAGDAASVHAKEMDVLQAREDMVTRSSRSVTHMPLEFSSHVPHAAPVMAMNRVLWGGKEERNGVGGGHLPSLARGKHRSISTPSP